MYRKVAREKSVSKIHSDQATTVRMLELLTLRKSILLTKHNFDNYIWCTTVVHVPYVSLICQQRHEKGLIRAEYIQHTYLRSSTTSPSSGSSFFYWLNYVSGSKFSWHFVKSWSFLPWQRKKVMSISTEQSDSSAQIKAEKRRLRACARQGGEQTHPQNECVSSGRGKLKESLTDPLFFSFSRAASFFLIILLKSKTRWRIVKKILLLFIHFFIPRRKDSRRRLPGKKGTN